MSLAESEKRNVMVNDHLAGAVFIQALHAIMVTEKVGRSASTQIQTVYMINFTNIVPGQQRISP